MKISVAEIKEYDAKELRVKAGVRYWEDTEVNGVEDTEGDLIPCRDGDMWCPIIDIDSGIIKNWKPGTVADVHYKVCDQFSCTIVSASGVDIKVIEDEYVPSVMCPKESGYGDYIIMDIDETGKIKDWNAEKIKLLTEEQE